MADRELKLRVLFDAADRLNKPLRAIAGGSRVAAAALKGTREELNRINDAQGQLKAFTTLRAGMRQSAGTMREAQQRAAALGREIAQTAKPTRALQREFAQATRTAEQLADSHRHDAAQLRELRTALQAAGADTRDLTRYETDLARRARETTRVMEDQSRTLERASNREQRLGAARSRFDRTMNTAQNAAGAGMGMLGMATATAAPLVASAKVAMDLEEGMAGVAKVTGMARGELRQMQNGIVELSARIPMTAVDLSKISAAAGAAGVGMDEFGKALPSQRADLLSFTDAAARMGIAFDMTAEDAGATMAKWRTAFKMTQPEVEALGDRINALTNRFGGNAAAVTEIVTRVGPLAGIAGLAAPQMAALGHYMNRVGVESEVAATGIKNTLLALVKGESATKSQQAAYRALGLEAVAVSKAMQTDASGTIINVLERIRSLSKDKQASILGELFGTESLGAIAPLLSNLDAVKTELKLVGDRSQYAGSMTAEFMTRIATTTGMTDLARNAFTAAGLGLGDTLLPRVREMALRFAAATLRMRAFTLRHPDLTRNVMMAAGALTALLAIAGTLTLGYAAMLGPMALFGALATATGIAMGPLILIVLGVVAAVALLAYGAYQLYNNWDGVVAWFGNLWSSIKGFFGSGIANITATILGWSPLGIFYRILQPVLGYFGIQLPAKFSDFGRMLITGLINGITARFAALKSTVMGVANSVMGWFRKPVQINSPSRVFTRYGGYLMEGLGNGIDRGAGGPLDRMARVSRELSGAMALGAATPALALGAAPTTPGNAGGGGFATMTVTIHINGADRAPREIGREVEDALERIDARRRAASFSQFADRPDWNV